MSLNDRESSSEESFTTTNVLLGYISKEPTDDGFSQLGGFPKWLDDSSPPSAELAKCRICNGMMTLLLQLNGDLPERFAGHERKLYIFSCRRKACRKKDGTIRAIRGVKISKVSSGKPKAAKGNNSESRKESRVDRSTSNLGNSIFNPTFSSNNSNPNPFSSSPGHAPVTNPFSPQPTSSSTSPFPSLASKPPQPPATDLSSTFADKARISSPPPAPASKEPWPSQSALPKPYPSYYLDADYESLEPDPPSSSKPAMQLDAEGSNNKDDEKDAFESTLDKTFQKFADRLAQNPEQVLRYEFEGTPLLYSKTDAVGKLFSPPTSPSSSKVKTVGRGAGAIPRCQNCASARVFELQLVPQAIAELEIEEEGLEGMEWGTIILGVCERDCRERGIEDGEVGWLEEWVGVQWEEAGEGRKG